MPSDALCDDGALSLINPKHWLASFPTSLFASARRRVRSSSSPQSDPASMIKFCSLCALWYSASALSSNTGKAILTQFRFPVTLTFVQFGFVAFYCLLFTSPLVRFTRLRSPTKAIFWSTLPMGIFQVGGHIFSSMAISRIPVSTVHTIKALSPLFTVATYAALFGVRYSPKTYVSLLPLTVGVMLACTFDISASNSLGLLCAFGSAIVFVTSNIFFKKIMPCTTTPGASSATPSHKLDKLNLLFFSSSTAFILMIPIWLYYDLPQLLTRNEHVVHPSHGHSTPHSVTYYFIMNGTVHFAQNIIAFVILSQTSPVTYSIASLIKRVVVICIAIVWFNQSVHPVQALGIGMTFVGLWMYNNAKQDVERGEKRMRRVEAARDLLLPSTKADHLLMDPSPSPALTPTLELEPVAPLSLSSAYSRPTLPQQPGFPFRYQQQLPSSSPPRYQQHHQHQHQHHHPNLHIKIDPPSFVQPTVVVISPKDSYPSPPPSRDSPPSRSIPLVQTSPVPMFHRMHGGHQYPGTPEHETMMMMSTYPPILESPNAVCSTA